VKRLLVSLDDERYEDLRRFAFEKKVPMAELVRHAIEATFEDELDAMIGLRGMEHYRKHPEDYMSWDDAKKELGLELSSGSASKSDARARKVAS
jgi:hypothetical protein